MHTLKNIGLSLMLTATFGILSAQDLPAPSPLGKVEQRVGLTDVSITYSRPGVKERVIFGELIPFGELWRTGANMATKFETSTDIMVMGNKLSAGAYALFTIPGEDKWTVIFNKEENQSGTGSYSEDMDAFRVDVAPAGGSMRETMTFNIDNVSATGGVIELHWEKTIVRIPFEVEFMETANKNIEAELNKLNSAYSSYNRIARFYVDNNINLDKALELAQKSVSMEKKFWNVYTLSLAQAANKQYKEAVKTAEMSLKLAEEAKYPPYVGMNKENIAKWSKMK